MIDGHPKSVVGVLLAGGQSTRMGGGDKCFRPLGGKTVLAHCIDRLRRQVGDIIINANGDASRFDTFGLPVIPDSLGHYAGPLAGVHAGIKWTKKHRPDAGYIVTVATDTPFFPADLVQRFIDELAGGALLAIARSAQGAHPVFGLWSTALAGPLQRSLKQGFLKASAFAEEQNATEVFFSPIEVNGRMIDPFFNINKPSDLAEAETLLKIKTR